MAASERIAAVLGGGAGARAAAAELALSGWKVRLWDQPEFLGGIAALLHDHHLEVDGVVQGRAELQLVTDDIADACEGASLLLIVTQAAGHRPIAEALAPVVTYDQTVVVMPGSTGGAIQVAHILSTERGFAPTVGETSTLPYAARARGERGVCIGHHVKLVKLAALPRAQSRAIARILKPTFPGLQAAANVLETSLSNGNPVIHLAVMLLNAAFIERFEGSWEFYADGVTPAVARLMEDLDEERLALGRAMDLELLPEPEMSLRQGYSRFADYLVAYRDGPGFQGLGGPDSLQHRYLTEDVAFGLVIWLELADVFTVPMPTAEAVVRIASAVLDEDLRGHPARGLEELGLAGMSAQEIIARCSA